MFWGDTPPIIRSSKTVIATSGFTYVFGCRPLRWLSHRSGQLPETYVKPEAAITVFELLMMGGVSPETCWAIKKPWNNKLYYTVASCWFFLWDLSSSYYYKYRDKWAKPGNLKTKHTLYKRLFTSVFNVSKYFDSLSPMQRILFISLSSLLVCAFGYQITAGGHAAFVFKSNWKAI